MKNSTVRISATAQQILREMAAEEKLPMQAIIERALEAYRRKRFLEQLNEAYAAEKATPYGRPALSEEMAGLDGTLADGLDQSESWSEQDRASRKSGKARGK